MYGKNFSIMYDGTLATVGPWQALVTFQNFIILSDQHGIVDMTPEAISRRTTIPLEIITTGIEALEKPDPQSRTPDEEGRRIVRLSENRPWGWRIVNYLKYRAIRTADDRREYHRQYARKRRAHEKGNKSQHLSTMSTGVNPKQPIAEAEAKTEEKRNKSAISDSPKRPFIQSFDEWYQEIKNNPAYQDIDLDRERGKMEAWLSTPKGRGRNLTKNFALNWLNKLDPGISVNGYKGFPTKEDSLRANLKKTLEVITDD